MTFGTLLKDYMNHSTYHRGQIVSIARNLELTDPPSTDFMRFVRLKSEGKAREVTLFQKVSLLKTR